MSFPGGPGRDYGQHPCHDRPFPALDAPLFPLFADLNGRAVLVVGGGAVAGRKVEALLHAGARPRVGAPHLSPPPPTRPRSTRRSRALPKRSGCS